MNYEKGLIYIATGLKYLEEAQLSAKSFKKNMPDIPIAVFTDDDVTAQEKQVFDLVIKIDDCQYGFIDKILSLKSSPWEKTIFLDTDTYSLNPCYEAFDLLDKFDLAVAHAPLRDSWKQSKTCPISFPELNTGVIVYRKSSFFNDLVEKWYSIYQHQKKHTKVPHDQPAFREALYSSNLRLTILTPEYNLRPNFSYFIGGASSVKIIHCRGHGLKKAIEVLTEETQENPNHPRVVEVKRNPKPNAIRSILSKVKHILKETFKI